MMRYSPRFEEIGRFIRASLGYGVGLFLAFQSERAMHDPTGATWLSPDWKYLLLIGAVSLVMGLLWRGKFGSGGLTRCQGSARGKAIELARIAGVFCALMGLNVALTCKSHPQLRPFWPVVVLSAVGGPLVIFVVLCWEFAGCSPAVLWRKDSGKAPQQVSALDDTGR